MIIGGFGEHQGKHMRLQGVDILRHVQGEYEKHQRILKQEIVKHHLFLFLEKWQCLPLNSPTAVNLGEFYVVKTK